MRRRDRHPQKARKTTGRLLATSLALVALFFAGAAVSAWAGSEGELAGSNEETGDTSTLETTTEQGTVPAEPPASEEDPAQRAQRLVRAYRSRHRTDRPVRRATAPALRKVERRASAAASLQMTEVPEPARPQAVSKTAPHRMSTELDSEAHAPGGVATIWLHRTLPDPTPPARRLSLDFAVQLADESRSAGVSWSLVLAVLRAQGHAGPAPASPDELRALAGRLAVALAAGSSPTDAVRALSGSPSLAEKAIALAHYNRAVGLYSLVTGLERAKARLERLVLDDPRIEIYAGGRDDIASGLIDVRVIVLIRYVSDTFGQASVSSLRTGHRLYARPGVVSAHVYGLAVDISAVGETSIAGHQEPGGITERAVQSILLLPDELQPQQVISLLGLGGPSFPLSDHADHIHVGY